MTDTPRDSAAGNTEARIRGRLDEIAPKGLEGPGAANAANDLEVIVDEIESYLYGEDAPGTASETS